MHCSLSSSNCWLLLFFFFNDTATTEIYTLSLHDALPIEACGDRVMAIPSGGGPAEFTIPDALPVLPLRDAVVFPLTAVPLAVGQPRSVRLVDDVMRGNRLLALAAQREAKAAPSAPEHLH